MLFKGDLSKYHPGDAMTFLSQVGTDGVLTIADEDRIITLTFKSGQLLDAHSAFGDQKLLRRLEHQGCINDTQIHQIQRIQRETGLSVRDILAKLAFFPLADIQPILATGILEVLRQLFLLDHGSFNFTETSVEDDGARIRMDVGQATLTVLPQADEYRDFVKTIRTTDRRVLTNGNAPAPRELDDAGRLVLRIAAQQPTVAELLDQSPLPSHEVLRHIQKFMDQGTFKLSAPGNTPAPTVSPALDPVFAAYKQALKTVLSTQEVLPRLSAVISFCKTYYDHMVVLTARNDDFIHCKTIILSADKGIRQQSHKGRLGRIGDEPIFATVGRSGIAFFGKAFPSNMLETMIGEPPRGECALVPLQIGSALSIFLYAATSREHSGVTPHHYLELLSWVLTATTGAGVPKPAATAHRSDAAAPPNATQAPPPSGKTSANGEAPIEPDAQKQVARMVSRIKELPPLPTLVSKALQMLSDPETPLEDIEGVIGQDQALVAKLIKVGNSALYGGLQKANTLRQVLARLGLKTTRNLVLAASTRSYFMSNRKGMRVWGQFLWQHAVEAGLAARRVAATLRYADPEEAFIGGLVHDIGKLIILMLYPDQYKEMIKLKKVNQMTSQAAESQMIGCDHEQVGRLLMDRWNMPDAAKACAQYHHRFQEAEAFSPLVAMVAYADYLSRQYGANPEPLQPQDQDYAQQVIAALNISEADRTALVDAVMDDFQNAELMME